MSPTEDQNRQTLTRLLDYLNNPRTTQFPPDQIWSDRLFTEQHPWPFPKGHGKTSADVVSIRTLSAASP